MFRSRLQEEETTILSDYRDRNGLKVPNGVEIHRDGKAFMDIEISEAQAFEKLDEAVFTKP
jgi:hypothetical protein